MSFYNGFKNNISILLQKIEIFSITLVILLLLMSIVLFLFNFISNRDLYASNRKSVPLVNDAKNGIILILYLHRIVLEENAAEASLALVVRNSNSRGLYKDNGETAYDLIKKGALELKATIYCQELGATRVTRLKSVDIEDAKSGLFQTIENVSDRFKLPLYRSTSGYPSDSYSGHFHIELETHTGHVSSDINIEKEFPGWIIDATTKSSDELIIKRSLLQILTFYIGTTLIIVIVLIVTAILWKKQSEFNDLESIIAFGGFVLTVISFREITGINSLQSPSRWDIILLVAPFFPLLIGLRNTKKLFNKNSE